MATLANRAKVTTATTGTGTITLGSAVSGFQDFTAAGVSNGATVSYVIEEGTAWEVGTGTYSTTGPTLTRTPSESSNAGSAINLAGNAQVYVTAIAGDLQNAADMDQGVATTDSVTFAAATVNGNITVTGTVDGRDVAADGTKLDGIEAGADVTDATNVAAAGALMTSGGTLTGNLSFGDNDKAIFGAGSDLQIYHDGSHSYIQDAGTGYLWLQGNAYTILGHMDGTEGVTSQQGAGVKLRYDNATKLATTSTGIDVTGTVVSDGLTVDGGGVLATFGNTAGNNSIGVIRTTTSPSSAYLGAYSNTGVILYSGSGGFKFTNTGTNQDSLKIANNGDISFYEDTGTTPKFFWDASAESLGIGTSSPVRTLDIATTTGGTIIHLTDDSTGHLATDGVDIQQEGTLFQILNREAGDIRFGTNNAEAMRIDSSGRVGIGTTAMSSMNAYGSGLTVGNSGISGSAGMTVYASANTGYSSVYFGDPDDTKVGWLEYNHNSDSLAVGAGNAERMRIDSSGRVMVGKTSTSTTVEGVVMHQNGFVGITRSLDVPLAVLRRDNDGDIVQFYRDATQVGSIGVNTAGASDLNLSVMSGDVGLRFRPNDDSIVPINGSGSFRDNAIDLGLSNARFKDLYLSNGVQGSGSISLVTGANSNIVKADGSLNALWSVRDDVMDLGRTATRWKNLYLSGGVYLGGTGAANKLDDYEQGEWTATFLPSVSGSITVSGTSTYTKVGQLVTFSSSLNVTSASSPVGYIALSLPFVASSSPTQKGRSAVSIYADILNTGANIADFIGLVIDGSSQIRIYLGDSNGAQADAAQQIKTGSYFLVSCSYHTDA